MATATLPATNLRDSALISAINAVGWDFHDSSGEMDAHNIHPYPAKFIPQIPRQILSLFQVPPDTAVLDPFAGSGTTLLEAQGSGHDFVGVDLNPIATLICRVKTTGTLPDAVNIARSVAASSKARCESRDFDIPEIPRLSHWFQPDVAAVMACITDEIEKADCDSRMKDLLRLSLSAITVRVSNQESETRYAALQKEIISTDVFRLFWRSTASITTKLQRSETLFSKPRPKGLIIEADSRRIGTLSLPPVSLVITSPPYPNAFEYWLYNKYRMYWLGFDPIQVREQEIGARPHYSCVNGDSIDDFLAQITATFESLSKHLTKGAHAAILVSSECRIRGQKFALPELLEQALLQVSFVPLTRVQRRIPRTRKSFNPDIGSIESETLLFSRWEG
jgi:DNA methylase